MIISNFDYTEEVNELKKKVILTMEAKIGDYVG
jgi:hypothetical protein